MSLNPYVVFATPTFSRHPSYEFCGAMEQAAFLFGRHGIKNTHLFYPGFQFIDAARNVLAKMMLEDHQDATDFFFIDDDVGSFQPEKVLEFVARQQPVVAASPPLKVMGDLQFPVALHATAEGNVIEVDGLMLARQVPAGFLRIKRPVIEQLAAKSDTYIVHEANGVQRVVFDIFNCGPQKGQFVGEDDYFCWRCAQEDIEIWLDPDVEFSHRGTHKWEGTFRKELSRFLNGTHPTAQLREMK